MGQLGVSRVVRTSRKTWYHIGIESQQAVSRTPREMTMVRRISKTSI